MEKRWAILLPLLLLLHNAKAQTNLVPNGDLEIYSNATIYWGCFGILVQNGYNPNDATPDYFNGLDPNEFKTPSNVQGYQLPHSKIAYAGIILFANSQDFPKSNNREYIQFRLMQKMQKDKIYSIHFYVSPTHPTSTSIQLPHLYLYNMGTDAIGIHISQSQITNNSGGQINSLIAVTPQIANLPGNYLTDTSAWYKISGCYVAQGGEEWITIGNFKDDAHTALQLLHYYPNTPLSDSIAYVYIDDVSVVE